MFKNLLFKLNFIKAKLKDELLQQQIFRARLEANKKVKLNNLFKNICFFFRMRTHKRRSPISLVLECPLQLVLLPLLNKWLLFMPPLPRIWLKLMLPCLLLQFKWRWVLFLLKRTHWGVIGMRFSYWYNCTSTGCALYWYSIVLVQGALLYWYSCTGTGRAFVLVQHCTGTGRAFVLVQHCTSTGRAFVLVQHCTGTGRALYWYSIVLVQGTLLYWYSIVLVQGALLYWYSCTSTGCAFVLVQLY